MPQEMRWPQFRTDTFSIEAEKIISIWSALNYPTIKNNIYLQEITVTNMWPDMTKLDAQLFLSGIMEIDNIQAKHSKEMNEVLTHKNTGISFKAN